MKCVYLKALLYLISNFPNSKGLYATQKLLNYTIPPQVTASTIKADSQLESSGIEPKSEPPVVTSPTLSQSESTSAIFQKFENKSINQLLNIGRKVKLVDLDLTKYLKIICSHLKATKAPKQEPSSSEQQQQENNDEPAKFDCSECRPGDHELTSKYLEKKFDELILKRFNLLPGFDDLFIFTPFQHQQQQYSSSQHHPTSDIDYALQFELNRQINSQKLRQRRRPDSLDSSQHEQFRNTSPKSFHDTEEDYTNGNNNNNNNYLSDFDYNFDETDDEKLNANSSFDDVNTDDSDDDSASAAVEDQKTESQHGVGVSGYFFPRD